MRNLASATLLFGAGTLVIATQPSPSEAETGLALGSCVVTGYGSKAVIIGKTNNGYKIRYDLTGGTAEQHHAGVTAAPCPAGAGGQNARPVAATPRNPQGVRTNGDPPVAQRTASGACFASETGGSGLEGTFRGVIRRQFEKQAAAGTDGTTTVRFLSFRMDGGRRATVIDRVNYKPDMSRPVYSVRALLQTCTDYQRATNTRTMERNFQCYTSSTGGANCSASGSMAGMRPDKNEYVTK